MSDERRNLDSLFEAAIEIASPEERAAFIEQQCGDDVHLRGQLQQLLASDDQAGSFLARPPVDLHATQLADQEYLAASLNAGLAPAFNKDQAMVLGRASHSVLKSLGNSIEIPRVNLRALEAEHGEPIIRPRSPEMPNAHSDSRYQLQGEIARGGMGAIIKGRDVDLGRELAIKVLLEEHKSKPEIIQRFVEEAQIGGQLQHPGIAPIYEFGQFSDQRPFFSMKLIKGQTLSKLLADRDNGSDDRGRFLGIFEQVCQTMAYAHSRGVIHRDLKPANIMVGAFGEVQVMDWGLAKVLPAGGVADEKRALDKQQGQSVIETLRSRMGSDVAGAAGSFGSQTQMGSVMGTPAYMPPEQALGEIDNLDERADVFGLGAILCEILTGQPPYVGTDGTAVFRLASRGKLDDCLKRLDGCDADEELITLTKECLAPEPTARPRDAGVLAERVTAYLESVETKLRETEMERAAEAARVVELHRRRKLHYAIATILLIGLVIAGFAANHFRSLEQTQRNLAATNEKLAKDREVERNAAIAAREDALLAKARETRLKEEALAAETRETKLKEAALQDRQRADAAATLAENRSLEIRKTLYANEMQIALNAQNQGGGALQMQSLLDHWRPAEGEIDLRSWEWFYLRSRLENAELVLNHPSRVTSADWSQDGQVVFTGCEDGVIRLWDAETGRQLRALPKSAPVQNLEVSPDGSDLASIDAFGALKIHKIDSGKVVLQTRLPRSILSKLRWSPNGSHIAVMLRNETFVVAVASRDIVARLRAQENDLNYSVDWNADGERLAITSGRSLIVWNCRSDEKTVFDGRFHNRSSVYTAEWESEGNRIIVGGNGGFYLADPQSGEVTKLNSLRDNERPSRLAFSKSHNHLAFAGFDYEVRLVDPHSWEMTHGLRGHTGEVQGIRWSPDESHLLTASLDGTVRIWQLNHLVEDYDHGSTAPKSVVWRPGSNELSVGYAKKIRSLTYPGYRETNDPLALGESSGAGTVSWSSDGTQLAVGLGQHWSIWDCESRQVTLQSAPEAENNDISFVSWEPGGDRLLVGWPGVFRLYSTNDGQLLQVWKIENRTWIGVFPEYAKWHPQGRTLAIADGIGVKVVDAETGQVQHEWKAEQRVTALAWHPSGELLATARKSDFLVELWELPTATRIAEISGGTQDIPRLQWSPDGSLLAIGGRDQTVRLWNRALERTVLTFLEDDPVLQMDWDHSGSRLAVSTRDRLKVYDAARGYLLEGSSRALTPLDQLIQAEPERALYRFQRARLLQQLGHWEEAAADWNKLSEHNPADSWYVEQAQRASLRALTPEDWRKRLAEDPSDALAARMLAERLIDEARPDDWELLDVQEAVSEGGAYLLPQPDGSLLAAGDNPNADDYRVSGKTSLRKVTAIRLEIIPDERLPNGGSGRASGGNFQLWDFALEQSSVDGLTDPRQLSLETAWADVSHPSYRISRAINGSPDEGWTTWPRQSQRHTAIFELAEALNATPSDLLTVRLRTGSFEGLFSRHNLGRFRLSVTDRPHAARLAELVHTLQQRPDAYDPWTLLGIVCSIHQETNTAAEAFSRALDQAAEDESRRMRILAQAARDEAVFQRIVKEHPEDSAIVVAHAGILSNAGESDAAIALLSGMLARNPDNTSLQWERVKVLAAAERWREAAEDLSAGLTPDHPTADDFVFRAEVFEKTGQWNMAVRDWEMAVERMPTDGALLLRLVDALLRVGNWAKAAETAQQRFESAPQDSQNWLRLAPALILSGNEAGYAAFCEELMEHVGKNPSLITCQRSITCGLLLPPRPGLIDRLPVARIRDRLGVHQGIEQNWFAGSLALVELRSGAFADAEAHAVTAAETGSFSGSDSLNLAVRTISQARQGKHEEARRSLEETNRLLGRVPNPRHPDQLIANILCREAEVLLKERVQK